MFITVIIAISPTCKALMQITLLFASSEPAQAGVVMRVSTPLHLTSSQATKLKLIMTPLPFPAQLRHDEDI